MEKKLQIIETPDYILAVSNEEIKEGEYGLADIIASDFYGVVIYNGAFAKHYFKKIIAYKPKSNAPELDLPLLSEMVVEDDVEKLAMDKLKGKWSHLYIGGYPKKPYPTNYENDLNMFMVGYYKAKSATKRYSKDDLIGFAEWIADSKIHGYSKQLYEAMIRHKVKTTKELLDVYLSLKQPKPKWFVAKIERVRDWDKRDINGDYEAKLQLKTITSNGKTYLVGKYLNE